MDQRVTDPGTELVLDNRRLILVFLLLILVCGAFFVIGFMEGKRQAVQPRLQSPPSGSPAPAAEGATTESKTADSGSAITPVTSQSVREQLDWYKNVQRDETGAGTRSTPPVETATVKSAVAMKNEPPSQAKAPQPPAKPPAAAIVPDAKAVYTVQAGAFQLRRQADIKAEELKARGFECSIEPSRTAKQLFLVKVGKFDSRADAVAMQRKLAKAGFSCFVKVN